MKVEIKIGEQEVLLSFNSQTFLIEDFKDTSVLQVGFWKKQIFLFVSLCFGGEVFAFCFVFCLGTLFFVLLVLF